ncbi:MAG: hypothetical protein AAF366_21445, partial [Pseudomonadota bacterium]
IGESPNHRGYVPFTEKGDYPDEVNRNYEAFDLGLDLPADDRTSWRATSSWGRMSGPTCPPSAARSPPTRRRWRPWATGSAARLSSIWVCRPAP